MAVGGWTPLAADTDATTALDMGPFCQTQSNPIHKYLVLNRTRKLRVTICSNADF